MIKLKNILKEFTDQNFQMRKEENPGKVGSLLSKVGFSGIAPDKKAYSRLKSFEGGKMFVHIQYHVIETKLGHVFIHQTQYWLKDKDVNVTKISVETIKGEWNPRGTTDRKDIGSAFVDTKKFLAALKRVNIIDRAQ